MLTGPRALKQEQKTSEFLSRVQCAL